jgi:hypothetical protein
MQRQRSIRNQPSNFVRRAALAIALVVVLALPAIASAAPLRADPASSPAPQAGPTEVQVDRVVQTDFGGRTLAIALSGAALLIATAGATYTVRQGARRQRTT